MGFPFRCASDWLRVVSGGLHRRDEVLGARAAYDCGAAAVEIHSGVRDAGNSAQDTRDCVSAPAAGHSRDQERDSTRLVRWVLIHGFLLLPAYWTEAGVSPHCKVTPP